MQVYLDLDGVLADFDRGATTLLGMAPGMFQELHGPSTFWKKLARAPAFYAELPLLPDAHELYRAVQHIHPIILTGLPIGKWAEPQKRKWVERHFPEVSVITTLARNKSTYCRPGDVLVDDQDKYRTKWEDAGGVFMHHRSARATITELRALNAL